MFPASSQGTNKPCFTPLSVRLKVGEMLARDPHHPRGHHLPASKALFSGEAGSRLSGTLELLRITSETALNIHQKISPRATASFKAALYSPPWQRAHRLGCHGALATSPCPSSSHTDSLGALAPSTSNPGEACASGGLCRSWWRGPEFGSLIWPALAALLGRGQGPRVVGGL